MGNFEAYYSALVDQFPDNDARGKAFERHAKKWLETDPLWSHQLREVVPWSEWEGRKSRDIGTDLVMTLKNGDVWSVQCKAEKPGESLKLSSRLSTFLGHSMGPVFAGRLLITTSSALSTNVEEMVSFQAKELITVFGRDLDESPIDIYALAFEEKTSIAEPPRKEVRDYQLEAAGAIFQELQQRDRAQISMACGTGKTFTSYLAWRRLAPRTTVFLVPSIFLLKQTLREWIAFEGYAPTFNWIAVCSDESVDNDPDLPGSKMQNFSSPTTTSSTAISLFLSKSGPKVIFSTYQSSRRIREALRIGGQKIDLLICDEAHRLVGETSKVADSLSLVYPKPKVVNKTLFMTATPKNVSESSKAQFERLGRKVLSMGDQSIFGYRCFSYTFQDAIPKYLAKYRIAISVVTDAELKEKINSRQLVSHSGKTEDLETLALHAALRQAIDKYQLTKVLSFHSRLKNAEKFSNQLASGEYAEDVGYRSQVVRSNFVSGLQNSDERQRRLNLLEGASAESPVVVTNARCLSEGIDVPTLNGVFFADPKYSEVDIVQALGRAIRSAKGKEFGTVIVPVFASTESDYEQQLSQSRWDVVWKTIRSLEAHDPALMYQLGQIRSELGERKPRRDLPDAIEFIGLERLPEGFADKIRTEIVLQTSSTWFEQLGKYRAKAEELQTGRVPQTLGRGAKKIPEGVWGTSQRTLFRESRLDDEQIRLLEEVDGWSWDPRDDDWVFALERCRIATEKFGHYLSIPNGYQDETGFRVRQWLGSLTSTARWNSIGKAKHREVRNNIPGFATSRKEAIWNLSLGYANDWLSEPKPRSSPEEIVLRPTKYLLSNWLKVNRRLWAKRNDAELTESQKSKLSRLRRMKGWAAYCTEALENVTHRSETKSTPASRSLRNRTRSYVFFHCQLGCERHGGKIGVDCSTEKVKVDFGSLKSSAASVAMLQNYLTGLSDFSSAKGTCSHPQTSGRKSFKWKEFSLGSQLNGIRQRRESFSPEFKKVLQQLPGWKWTDDADEQVEWDKFYVALCAYVEEFGTARVSQGETYSGLPLGDWVARQLKRGRGVRGKPLTSRQRRLLLDLPDFTFEPWTESRKSSSRDKVWMENFAKYRDYVELTGDCFPKSTLSVNGFYPGRWARTQRDKYLDKTKPGVLTEAEIDLLKGLKCWSWTQERPRK